MTRVQRRVLRRRRRKRRVLLIVAVLAVCFAVTLALRNPSMQAEWIGQPSPSPKANDFNREVVTREVLLPAQTWYTIQTGVFSTKEAAAEKAGAYADRGAPGIVVADGGKWRVFIASYGREEDASAVRQRLGEQQRVETYLYPWVCPELHLRLSGMAGQLDAAEAGITLLTSAAGILRDTAMLLDASQVTAEDAWQVVSDLNAQIDLWISTAHDRFGRQPPELVAQVLKMAEGWQGRCAVIGEKSDSATALSAELKMQGMGLYEEMICMRRSICQE